MPPATINCTMPTYAIQEEQIKTNYTAVSIGIGMTVSATDVGYTAAPTTADYEQALIKDGASPEFAKLFAERITDFGDDYEVINM